VAGGWPLRPNRSLGKLSRGLSGMKLAEMTQAVEAEIRRDVAAHIASIPLEDLASAVGENDDGNPVIYMATDRGFYVLTYTKGTAADGRRGRMSGELTAWEDVTRPLLAFAGFGGKYDHLTFRLAAPAVTESTTDASALGFRPLLDLADECNRRARGGWRRP
jgi:hypothetical protein